MSMDPALQTLIVESRELLQAMEDALYDIENAADRDESINAIFRAAHTIKGSAGLFGLDDIVAFTHVAESVLDKVRAGKVEMDAGLVALFLACGDHIATMIDALEAGADGLDENGRATGAALMEKLSVYLGAGKPAASAVSTPASADEHVERMGGDRAETDNWHISLRFSHDVLRNGMDPLSFLRYMGKLGQIVAITTLHEGLPPLQEMDAEACYLGYEISFHSNADKAAIEGIFEFVHDDAQIHIIPPRSRIAEYVHFIQELPEEDMRLGQILVKCGTLTEHELAQIIDFQGKRAEAGGAKPPIGEILVSEGIVAPQVVDAALEKQKQVKEIKAKESQVIRVDAERLDQLINLVGELVIAGASATLLSQRGGDTLLQEATSNVSRLVEEIRDSALQLRMVQIGETFKRFNRVVRDVSRELGKDIELSIGGAETELDKTVVDRIGDPLMHLVRNSMDHGIESPEVRLAKGKPARGKVRLNAYHESGSIVIEVGDDGGGLNKERILKKAIEKGVVEAGQSLSDQEIYNLIFAPGFSTAEQVTNLSGRGVGMDVVRRNIEALRGTIELDSQEDVGSTTRIRLPLTLAIIDGFLMGVGSASYVVPLDMVVECMELSEAERQESQGRDFINLRGAALPFVRLREQFREPGKPGRRENIVVVQYGNQKAGFVVDQLMGEFQTVIKPLGKLFGNLKGISGSTILGSGDVALILDVPALIQQAVGRETRDMVTQ
ncbi:MAG: chemotaxis protein CheA [Sulfuricella sp.]|nr:chemotaxis protein CheA [Sulfuricella sp.]